MRPARTYDVLVATTLDDSAIPAGARGGENVGLDPGRTERTPPQTRTLGRGPDGWPLPRLARRYRPPHWASDALVGWLAPIGVTLFAALIRFWNITSPRTLTFDENYYAKHAWALLTKGYAAQFTNQSSDIINSGSTKGIYTGQVEQIVHPPLGKWMIAVGEYLFGLTPLGWRFSSAIVGSLTILVLCRLVRRLTGSTLLGCAAGVLLALDGLEFVMSRFALIDIFLTFWLLCAVHCLVADRDWARLKMARRLAAEPDAARTGFGPVRGFLWRPWRVAAGACFGCAAGVKWSGVFVLIGFGFLTWAWDSGMRRAAGVPFAVAKSAIADALPAAVSLVLVAVIVYVACWSDFLVHHRRYAQQFGHGANSIGNLSGPGMDWGSYIDERPTSIVGKTEQAFHELWDYHVMTYKFNTGPYLTRKHSPHPYMSEPRGWLILNRPLGVANISGNNQTVNGCKPSKSCTALIDELNCPPRDNCVRQVKALGTPVLWWGGVIALVIALFYWIFRRDWRFGVPVMGVATTWLPWFGWEDRTIFYYYAVSIIPFTVIAVALVLGKALGPAHAHPTRRTVGAVFAGAFVLAVALNFFYMYPIYGYERMTLHQWQQRMWFSTWN
jgi:dolichyl-phosphate-mannose-protein mannosyltransferase